MNKFWMFLLSLMLVSSVAFAAADTEAETKPIKLTIGSGGTSINELYFGLDTVASGQTSKATTITGLSTSARCMVVGAEDPTNDVYILAVVETANTMTVTVSGDPGASNLDFNYLCVE